MEKIPGIAVEHDRFSLNPELSICMHCKLLNNTHLPTEGRNGWQHVIVSAEMCTILIECSLRQQSAQSSSRSHASESRIQLTVGEDWLGEVKNRAVEGLSLGAVDRARPVESKRELVARHLQSRRIVVGEFGGGAGDAVLAAVIEADDHRVSCNICDNRVCPFFEAYAGIEATEELHARAYF